MGEELKPCPFCGGEANVCRHPDWEIKKWFQVECCKCDLEQPEWYASAHDSIKAWNARADNATIEALRKELSECKAEVHKGDIANTELSDVALTDIKTIMELEAKLDKAEAQLTTIRNETIDECAGIATGTDRHTHGKRNDDIAAAILKLKVADK